MGIDLEIFGLPNEYAYTRICSGCRRYSNNTWILSIHEIFMSGVLSALMIDSSLIEANYRRSLLFNQMLALVFGSGSKKTCSFFKKILNKNI